jgi:hypothetical protein
MVGFGRQGILCQSEDWDDALSAGPDAHTDARVAGMQDAGQVNVERPGPFAMPRSATHDASCTQDALPGQTQPPVPPIPTELEAQAASHPRLLPGGLVVTSLTEGVAIAVALMLPTTLFRKTSASFMATTSCRLSCPSG